ncbi:MAG: SOS response-associated peptidase family protein [Sphingobacterium sp.]
METFAFLGKARSGRGDVRQHAESESIFQKANYKSYISRNRRLLYSNGFYEPHTSDTGAKENYYIYVPSTEIFMLGIVYSDWTDQSTGDLYSTVSVVTTPANPVLKKP